MRALKALQIGMAVLIFAGVVALILGIIDKTDELDSEISRSLANFGTTQIALPADSQIRESQLDGDKIMLRLTLADGGSQIILISANNGEKIGVIDLNSAPEVP